MKDKWRGSFEEFRKKYKGRNLTFQQILNEKQPTHLMARRLTKLEPSDTKFTNIELKNYPLNRNY